MSQYSHSKVECHNSCHYKYKLRYVDKFRTIPDYTADNALICGNTMHQGAETNLADALKFYYSNYPIISDDHVHEVMKFTYLIPKIHEILDGINVYKKEFSINTSRFIGIVDLITKNDDGTVDVFDYKYSNAVEKYSESPQLHLYKYFLEQMGFKVRKLGFIFIPKVAIKQKKEESLYQFRYRLQEELKISKIRIMEVQYDAAKVIDFMDDIIKINEDEEYKKLPTRLCDWCDYKKLCLEENDVDMQLPSNKRREVGQIKKRVMWIYGAPFCGKTTFANDFPEPLMLNTDGNIKFVDAPYISIKDEIKVEGRITNKTLAWQVFKDTVAELEKKQNDFKTIIVDLVEDTYEYCRLFKYDEMGITHESDDSFRAWDKVRTEFLSTLKRLLNLDYENIILISHVDTSKDITKKAGDKITKIAPNLNEKCANKVAGMVDIVARVIAEDGNHTLNFKTSEVIFGGGRLHVKTEKIPLELEKLMKVYDEANVGKKDIPKTEEKTSRRSKKADEPKEESKEGSVEDVKVEETNSVDETQKEDKPKRSRKSKEESTDIEKTDDTQAEDEATNSETKDTPPVEDKPKRRRSRKED
ncbi:MAG: AAA family ATPase [Clostridium sp.]|uniref:AAA family ATPase n=1 Tax=Clostridium sp. TaxID=1506 RepID=UPI003053DA1E